MCVQEKVAVRFCQRLEAHKATQRLAVHKVPKDWKLIKPPRDSEQKPNTKTHLAKILLSHALFGCDHCTLSRASQLLDVGTGQAPRRCTLRSIYSVVFMPDRCPVHEYPFATFVFLLCSTMYISALGLLRMKQVEIDNTILSDHWIPWI